MAISAVPECPWHVESWHRFVNERLPELLAERIPLGGYQVEYRDVDASRVTITLSGESGEAQATYRIPMPDTCGVFSLRGRPHIVLPTASSDDLATAEIRCAGEQAVAFVADRLGQAAPDIEWDDARLEAWLPLEVWITEFLTNAPPLDESNWLSRNAHLRRIVLPKDRRSFTSSQFGRVCPIETPEGPNIGRVLTIARGATIRDGRIVVTDPSPEAGLGCTASMVPFLEHSDSCRLVMSVNMMRLWPQPPDPEPALVQTGSEPDDPSFWCGRNLLTAYVMAGCDTFEDAIVVSESCARRLGYPAPAQPGDKLSNRSGNKGVIGKIVPDDAMPHLPDGTPVELVFSPLSLPSRMTWSQLKEAAISWRAHRRGVAEIMPPFHAPQEVDIRSALAEAGVPDSGQQLLVDSKGGKPFAQPSTVGWVYWGKLAHRSGPKLRVTSGATGGQRVGEAEFHALLHAGATETIRELFCTRNTSEPGAGTLTAQMAGGALQQAAPPSPMFGELSRRLRAAGIATELAGETVCFSQASPTGPTLDLAIRIRHPWNASQPISKVGVLADVPELRPLEQANTRLARLLERSAPEKLRLDASADLAARTAAYLDSLVSPRTLGFRARTTFSAHAVAVPDCSLHFEQIGLPETIAWALFGPLAARELHDPDAVAARAPEARAALQAAMSRSWVLVHRVMAAPASFVAFRPVLQPDPVIRVHPFTCRMLNADFDGDELLVSLPVTDAGQREAGEKMTIEAYVRREISPLRRPRPLLDAQFGPFLYNVRPTMESRFGLVWIARSADGHSELERIAGAKLPLERGTLTGNSILAAQMELLERCGVHEMLEAMHRLLRTGFEASRTTGASLSPFECVPADPPTQPETDDPDAWWAYLEEYIARIDAHHDDPASDEDTMKLTLRSGARATVRQWVQVVGARGLLRGPDNTRVPVRHGFVEGLAAEEFYVSVIGMRDGLVRAYHDFHEVLREVTAEPPAGHGVMARAMRARRPGVVFARAAAAKEVDPLESLHARLFVGLPSR